MKDRNENRPGYKKTKVGWIPEEWICHKSLDITKEIGRDIRFYFNGIVDECRRGVYKVRNPKNDDYCFAREHELKQR